MFVQPTLFPISALQTEGYAEPEPRDEAEADETQAEEKAA